MPGTICDRCGKPIDYEDDETAFYVEGYGETNAHMRWFVLVGRCCEPAASINTRNKPDELPFAFVERFRYPGRPMPVVYLSSASNGGTPV